MPAYSGPTDDDSFADSAPADMEQSSGNGDDKDSGYPDVLIAKSACPGMEVGSKLPLRVKAVLDDQYLCVYTPDVGEHSEDSEDGAMEEPDDEVSALLQ